MSGDVWYRYEDRKFSVANEWGEHDYTRVDIQLFKFPVEKRTPKGAWLRVFFSRRWVSLHATKRFACPTLEEAAVSFVARKTRQRNIHQARADAAQHTLSRAQRILDDLRKELAQLDTPSV